MPETESIIEIRGARKTYRGITGPAHRALDDVDLEVRAGEVLGLVGPNGAGKTTLLTCMLGLQRPDRGEVRVLGRAADALGVRARTGYLPERLGFDRDLTGRQFLALHAALAGIPAAQRPSDVARLAERVELAASALGRSLRTYSRGMLQRIGLAQALFGRPALLFLDEPASGMDPVGVAMVRRVIREAKAEGATVVLNSHQLDELERVCDRVAFLERGAVQRLESLGAEPTALSWRIVVAAGGEADAVRALHDAGLVPIVLADGSLRVDGGAEVAERVAPALVARGLRLRELTPRRARLEDLFFPGGRPV